MRTLNQAVKKYYKYIQLSSIVKSNKCYFAVFQFNRLSKINLVCSTSQSDTRT